MTNDMYLSLDLYKIVSDYSGVNQLKFPPTTIQILNALTSYIKNYDDSVKTLQEKVDNLTTDGLPNYMELESATSGETQDSVIKLNGIMNVENGGNTVNGEYHISIPTDGTLKATGLGKLGVDFVPRYFKQILFVNKSTSPLALGGLAFSFVSNVEKNSYTLLEIFEELYNLYGTYVNIPCWGVYIPTTGVQASILSITITEKTETTIDLTYRVLNNGSNTTLEQLYSLTDNHYTTTCISTPLFVPAKTDTI